MSRFFSESCIYQKICYYAWVIVLFKRKKKDAKNKKIQNEKWGIITFFPQKSKFWTDVGSRDRHTWWGSENMQMGLPGLPSIAIPILEKQQKSEYRRASCNFFSILSLHVKKNYGPDHLQSALIIDLYSKNSSRHTLDYFEFRPFLTYLIMFIR